VDSPYVSPHRITRFREQVLSTMSCVRTIADVEQEIETRRSGYRSGTRSQIGIDIPGHNHPVFTLTPEEQTAHAAMPTPVTVPVSSLIEDDLE
jgi:hypothetical protein